MNNYSAISIEIQLNSFFELFEIIYNEFIELFQFN